MSECEHFEVELSALADGELEPASIGPAVDHLAGCPACRTFYRRSREADELLAARRPAGASTPAASVWERIERDAGANVVALPSRRRPPGWALAAAASLLVLLGLMTAGLFRTTPASADSLEVRLESDGGRMTDERFVRLTAELLRADRRYHRKMMEILGTVNARTFVDEGGEASALATVRRVTAISETAEDEGEAGADDVPLP